jgi:hypothetical protein
VSPAKNDRASEIRGTAIGSIEVPPLWSGSTAHSSGFSSAPIKPSRSTALRAAAGIVNRQRAIVHQEVLDAAQTARTLSLINGFSNRNKLESASHPPAAGTCLRLEFRPSDEAPPLVIRPICGRKPRARFWSRQSF